MNTKNVYFFLKGKFYILISHHVDPPLHRKTGEKEFNMPSTYHRMNKMYLLSTDISCYKNRIYVMDSAEWLQEILCTNLMLTRLNKLVILNYKVKYFIS